jgi:glycosyltransferase involved in cell wall biosynthesis
MFASKYLQRNQAPELIRETPDSGLGISVVIPCFREPNVLQTLRSVACCVLPETSVEVILLINHSEAAPESVKEENRQTKYEVDKWISQNNSDQITFFAVGPVALRKKWAGAGLARKRGMDEAVRRFNLLNKPEGLIVSLDADTLVEKNYLTEIENYFKSYPGHVGATIHFEHQATGLDAKHLQGIRLYEKYMNYYKMMLGFTGYPNPMFTVGSAFAVTAGAYVKRGGMNRRQAGEDFYFLQNLAQIGRVGEITSTCVHPSARLSDRVPFGTGPILQKWMKGEEDLTKTYDFQSFSDLKQFFDKKDQLFNIEKREYQNLLSQLSRPVQTFLTEDNFWQEISDLNANCSTLQSFQTRFFQKFNAFKILKFLNFTHDVFYQKSDLLEQVAEMNKTRNS